MVRAFKMLAVTLAVAGVAAGFAAAGVTQNDVKLFVPYDGSIACANGGAGEAIIGFVNIHMVFTTTVNGNNVSGTYHSNVQGGILVGDSGAAYQPTGAGQEKFSTSLQNGHATLRFVQNQRIIGQGPSNNVVIHEVSNVTFNANGVPTVQFEKFTFDCK